MDGAAKYAMPVSPTIFRNVVEAHQRGLYYLCRDLTGNHHDAQDLAQDVFVKAYHAIDSFNGSLNEGGQVFAWLRRIAINAFLNSRRAKKHTMTQVFSDGHPETDHANTHADHSGAHERAERASVNDHVRRALTVLSARERTAFTLRHFHGLPVDETAASMDVASGTVKSLLHRATKKLQHELDFLREERFA